MVKHNKLVRDRIPDIIRADGKKCTVRVLKHSEMLNALSKKLREEVDEYLDAHDPEELADILEIIYATAQCAGLTKAELEQMREAKAAKNGGFRDRLYLIEVEG